MLANLILSSWCDDWEPCVWLFAITRRRPWWVLWFLAADGLTPTLACASLIIWLAHHRLRWKYRSRFVDRRDLSFLLRLYALLLRSRAWLHIAPESEAILRELLLALISLLAGLAYANTLTHRHSRHPPDDETLLPLPPCVKGVLVNLAGPRILVLEGGTQLVIQENHDHRDPATLDEQRASEGWRRAGEAGFTVVAGSVAGGSGVDGETRYRPRLVVCGCVGLVAVHMQRLYLQFDAAAFALTTVWENRGVVLFWVFVALPLTVVGLLGLLQTSGSSLFRKILWRKFFHGVALLICAPTLIGGLPCAVFIAIAWLGASCAYLVFELLRVVGGLSLVTHEALALLTDERDHEFIVVTPLYLILGVQLSFVASLLILARTHTQFLFLAWAGVCAVCIGDAFAALVPTALQYTRLRASFILAKIYGKKTCLGLLVFAASTYTALRLLPIASHGEDFILPTRLAFAAAAITAAIAETYSKHVDNYWVAIVALAVVSCLTRSPASTSASPPTLHSQP